MRVKPEQLSTFLKAADITEGFFQELEAYTSVLLESSFALQTSPIPVSVKMKWTTKKKKDPQTGKSTTISLGALEDTLKKAGIFIRSLSSPTPTNSSQPQLVAIRLRIRLADHVENEKTLFKLGFKVAAGLSISLDKVQSVGNESVLDVYVHWFGPYTPYNINNSAEAYEQSVPAVALLHQ